MKYKIGYLDEDAGWNNTFRHYFKENFDIVLFDVDEQTTLETIFEVIEKKELDALIIDFKLDETGKLNFNGDAVAKFTLERKPHFPLMMLTAYERDAVSYVEDVNIINSKDILDGESQEKVDILIHKVRSNINNYYTKISITENRIKELIEKKNRIDLSLSEEEELTKLYMFLDEIFPDEKVLPENLIQPEAITRLNEFVLRTKEILEQLKKNK